ncbi:MAG: heavy-metal-associated domain-containing protein [Campylobacterota bacterium]|nr:heavy-metal-associated domain-containing protein [Campylobacterota bacterium]
MKQIFKVQNVKCGGCASTLKSKLLEEFGAIEVNLELQPREISLEIQDAKVESLKIALRGLGYPLVGDELNFLQNNTAKAKSFVSCAVGKFDVASNQTSSDKL